ncbi:DegT/DnrJ/EryC1/StrS family aminotransferase [Nonlabens xiamenensis]|uniref:DegT/DnrJ/EryC1/StrS family aminotransferase n=1 Tax=Nonlabens xiamenensis TaxID=2341043 RepID=UPI000F607155|nr:DegT/DnrJ/EryC1/StrS family aminotransferase [Nonlabens xiamenensis]
MKPTQIPYLDLPALQARFALQDQQTLTRLHEVGQFIGGAMLEAFENEFASYCGVGHAVGTANGLDALRLILLADQELGILPQKARILVPAHTYIASFLSIIHAGMHPIPVDVGHLNLDLKAVEACETSYDGILAVDLYGKMVADEVYDYAKEHDIPIYCDTAQSHGAINATGKKAGSLARASAFSFYPTKNLGALGDGGAITTDDHQLAGMCRKLGNYGRLSRYENDQLGLNSRLDPLQAGFLSTRLELLDEDNSKRKEVAQYYYAHIKNERIDLLPADFLYHNALHVFPVLVADRDALKKHLEQHGIGYSCHYEIPPHQQPALSSYNFGVFPRTELLHRQELSLPCHPLLTAQQMERIVDVINKF